MEDKRDQMLQFTQVLKITGVVLVTRRVFWGQNATACSRLTAPPPNCMKQSHCWWDARGKAEPHNRLYRASEMASLLLSCTQTQPGRHTGGGAPCYCLWHLGKTSSNSPGGPNGGDSGKEEASHSHQQSRRPRSPTLPPPPSLSLSSSAPPAWAGRAMEQRPSAETRFRMVKSCTKASSPWLFSSFPWGRQPVLSSLRQGSPQEGAPTPTKQMHLVAGPVWSCLSPGACQHTSRQRITQTTRKADSKLKTYETTAPSTSHSQLPSPAHLQVTGTTQQAW